MRVYANDFIYNNIPCEQYNLMLCDFQGGAGAIYTSSGSSVEISTNRSPNTGKWNVYDVQYNEPLKFTFHVMKCDESGFDIRERAAINQWLMKKDGYTELQLNSPEYFDVIFLVMVESIKEISVGGKVYGMEINFIADAPFGYSPMLKASYKIDETNKNIEVYNNSDETGIIYPDIMIEVENDSDVSIIELTDKTTLSVLGCKKDEIITISALDRSISTSLPSHDIVASFNWNWLKLHKEIMNTKNLFTINGNCTITFIYREIRKVGIG